MSSLWPLLAIVIWAALILATSIQNRRLIRLFRERYPQVAQKEIPFVFDKWRHPEKAIYFFRKRAVEVLRPDPQLWRERQRFVMLVVATVGFWVAGAVTICILGILLT
jgi:hypothetical protein